MDFIDLFAGIGGFRRGLELAGHTCKGFCEFDKYATASYTSMHCINEEQRQYLSTLSLKQRQKEILKEEYRNGEWYCDDIRKVTADNVPKVDIWTFGSPCFVKGTLVLTDNGYKPIEELHINDKVITHTNQYRKVTELMQNTTDTLYDIKSSISCHIKCTPNHPFYIRKKKRIWDKELRKYNKTFEESTWIEAKDLSIGDYVGTAINTIEELPVWNGYDYKIKSNSQILKNKNELSALFEKNDFWYVVGRYIGDGWTTNNKKSVIICGNKNKIDTLMPKLDNLNLSYYVSKERTAYKIHVSKKELNLYLFQFGKGAKNKHLTADIINLPKQQLESFLMGYIESDGCYLDGKYCISSISKQLIYDISVCIMKVFHTPTFIYESKVSPFTTIEGRTVHQNPIYEIRWKVNKTPKDHFFYENGFIWSPIKKIDVVNRQTMVYNLEVEEDHSYMIENMIVHNCQDFSIAGKRRGLEGDRSSLVREVFRIIGEIKEQDRPEWLIYENVKGMFSQNRGFDYLAILFAMDELGFDIEWQLFNSKDFGVPQNRERVYTVGHLRRYGGRKIFPITGTDGKDSIHKVDIIGHRQNYRRNTQVFSPNGYTEALDTGQGGGRGHYTAIPLKFGIDYNVNGVERPIANTIKARYDAGVSNQRQTGTAVAITIPKMIGGIGEKSFGNQFRQGNRIYSINGISPCLQSNQGGTSGSSYLINGPILYDGKQKKWLDNQITGTLTTESYQAIGHSGTFLLIQPYAQQVCKPQIKCTVTKLNSKIFPCLTPDRIEKRQNGRRFKEDKEPAFTLTAQDIHGVAIEVRGGILKTTRSDYGKEIRKDYENHNIDISRHDFLEYKISDDNLSNTISTVPKDNYLAQPAKTINVGNISAVWYDKYQCYITIRKLTPKECFRLQGWTDDYFEKAEFVNTNSQLYKQAGNGVTVNVVYAIGKALNEEKEEKKENTLF